MKLSQLASKPQLIKITIDDESIVEKYNEAVEFWMHDRHSMDTFMKLANVKEDNITSISQIMKEIVLDEKGNKILDDGEILPSDIMMKVITQVVERLGNLNGQTTSK